MPAPYRFLISRIALAGFIPFVMLVSCGNHAVPRDPLGMKAELSQDDDRLFIVLQNRSGMPLTLCKRNFHLPFDYLDIRHYPDTTKLPFEMVFGKKPCVMKRRDVTVSDFVTLPADGELRLPVDFRCVQRGKTMGDTIFVSVTFMNLNPFICSRLELKKHKPEIQTYCELFHYVPKESLSYWEGEVKTPFLAYALPPKPAPVKTVRRSSTR